MNPYYEEYINFLKKHNIYNKEILNYQKYHTYIVDYRDEDERKLIGCSFITSKYNILKQINLCIPTLNSKIAILINIHEYIHLLTKYKYLNKKFKLTDNIEILPILYETLYVLETNDEALTNYYNKLNETIKKDSQKKYQIALIVKEELLNYYNENSPTYKKLEHKAKKLTKKLKKANN